MFEDKYLILAAAASLPRESVTRCEWLKLFQLINIFHHVQCRLNTFEIISELFQRLK